MHEISKVATITTTTKAAKKLFSKMVDVNNEHNGKCKQRQKYKHKYKHKRGLNVVFLWLDGVDIERYEIRCHTS